MRQKQTKTYAADIAAKTEKLICEVAKLKVSGNSSTPKVEELKQELAPVLLETLVEGIAAGQLSLHISCPPIKGDAGCLLWAEPKTATIVGGIIVVEATATRVSVVQNMTN
jgi:hypothetical protein